MAYCNGSVYHDKITRVLCDECAEAGEVPFELDKDGVKMQEKPWRWHPVFGGKCDKCKKQC